MANVSERTRRASAYVPAYIRAYVRVFSARVSCKRFVQYAVHYIITCAQTRLDAATHSASRPFSLASFLARILAATTGSADASCRKGDIHPPPQGVRCYFIARVKGNHAASPRTPPPFLFRSSFNPPVFLTRCFDGREHVTRSFVPRIPRMHFRGCASAVK